MLQVSTLQVDPRMTVNVEEGTPISAIGLVGSEHSPGFVAVSIGSVNVYLSASQADDLAGKVQVARESMRLRKLSQSSGPGGSDAGRPDEQSQAV